ncbi:MAG: OmpA family protein [Bacteriovoracia bacterium]
MSNRFASFLVVLGILICVLSSHAEERKFTVYGGLGAGYVSSQSSISTEPSKNGYQLDLKLTLSVPLHRWVLDSSVGWMYNRLKGGTGTSVDVKTSAGYVQVSPLYRFENEWHLGPTFSLLAGSDVSFSQSAVNTYSVALIGGLRLQKEFATETANPMRVGTQFMTDFTIANRQIYWAQVDFSLGFIDRKGPDEYAQRGAGLKSEHIQILDDQGVQVTLDDRFFHFKTASDELEKGSEGVLHRLSEYLKTHPGSWQSVEVRGHTDKRGKAETNVKLSFDRATAVGRTLVNQGLPSERVVAKGFGSQLPVAGGDTEQDHLKNRRVELRLNGVSRPQEMSDALNWIWINPPAGETNPDGLPDLTK